MPQQLLFEGADLEVLLAQVRAEHGHHARIVKAERVRSGGVGGFFAKERYELTISLDSPATIEETPPPVAATERPQWASPTPLRTAGPPARAVPSRPQLVVDDELSVLLDRADASDATVAPTGMRHDEMVDDRPVLTMEPQLSTHRSAFDEILMSVRAQLGGTDAPAPEETLVRENVDVVDVPTVDTPVSRVVQDIMADIAARAEAPTAVVSRSAPVPAPRPPFVATAPPAVTLPSSTPAATPLAIGRSATPLLDEMLRSRPVPTAAGSAVAPVVDATTLACALSLSGISPTLSAEVAEAACAAGPLAADVAPVLAARQLVSAVALPSGPGDVIVVAGAPDALAVMAGPLGELLAVDGAQMVAIGDIPGMPTGSLTGSVEDVAAVVAQARAASSPVLVVVATAETMAGARRCARTAVAVGATGVVGAWDCGRDPYDGLRWLAEIAGFDSVARAMALTGCGDAGAVAGAVTAGAHVILLDGRPATAGAWAALLVDRMDQIVGAGLVRALRT